MIAITFAVPEESSRFRRVLTETRRTNAGVLRLLEGKIGSTEVVVAHVGMGLEAARNHAALLLKHRQPELVIAAGFGGALAPELGLGDVVIDFRSWLAAEESLLREMSQSFRKGTIVSQPSPAETPEDKARLAAETGAVAVDMETDAIETVCAQAGVPLLALRAISDRAADPLPVPLPAWYDIKAQRSRPAVLVGYLLTHPGAIMPFVRFLSGLPTAQRALAEVLVKIVEQRSRLVSR